MDQMVSLWNDNLPGEFAASKKQIKDKIFDDQDLCKDASFELLVNGQLKGFVVSKINNSGMVEYADCAWISVLLVAKEAQNSGAGSMLLARAEGELNQLGIKKIILGGELNNFFSGIPDPTVNKVEFFQHRDYTVNHEEHFDLMADVSKLDFDKLDIRMNNSDDFRTVPYQEGYFESLMTFFDDSFPGRWKFELINYLEAGGKHENLLVMLHQDKIIGFCRVFKSEVCTDSTVVYGENYGSLGPIGINEAFRGKGVGNRILCDSFKILKARGTENVLIDWTILKDFYGQFGFVPLRTYRGAYKRI